MSRISGFSSPFLLGFDELERALDQVTRSANDGYPPYNIERLRKTAQSPDMIRITLAVAGFDESELDITLEEKQLSIKGKQVDDNTREYLHRGIASRQFQRSFVLAEGLEIRDAQLNCGLLMINLIQPQAKKTVKTIKISNTEKSASTI